VQDRSTLEPAAGAADYIVNRMREEGVLLSTDGPLHNVIKIKPPMVFDEDDVDELARKLENVLGDDFVRASTA
jgi:4-aminobutyrate aminotransferase-like enzyme